MSLRADQTNNMPAHHEDEHTVVGHWEPGRLWLAMKDGRVLAETSDPADDAFQDALDQGAVSYQQKWFIPADHYWVVTDPPTRRHPHA